MPAPNCIDFIKFEARELILVAALLLAGCATNQSAAVPNTQIARARVGTQSDYELQEEQARERASLMSILTISRPH